MISVCMATYNGERFIKQQIDSILCQLNPEDELIISDDGSTDETLKIIESYHESRIKVFHHEKKNNISNHKKATLNFENALLNAKGDFIFLSDQDDIWLPNKVQVCVNELNTSDFVVHNMTIIDQNNYTLEKLRFEKDINPLPKNWLSILVKMNLRGCTMAFRRECLNYLLPIPYNIVAHDYWISCMCIKKGLCKYIEAPLILYREHFDSVSYKKKTSLFYKLNYRLELFFNVLIK